MEPAPLDGQGHMKALSIRQPWAWAILNAGKTIENRSRADGLMPPLCNHRGPLLLHASKGCTRDEFIDARMWMVAKGLATLEPRHATLPYVMDLNVLHRGGVMGMCLVVGAVGERGQLMGPGHVGPSDLRWHVPGSFGLVLADVRPLPFLPFKGALGLFEVPDHLFAPEVWT